LGVRGALSFTVICIRGGEYKFYREILQKIIVKLKKKPKVLPIMGKAPLLDVQNISRGKKTIGQ